MEAKGSQTITMDLVYHNLLDSGYKLIISKSFGKSFINFKLYLSGMNYRAFRNGLSCKVYI